MATPPKKKKIEAAFLFATLESGRSRKCLQKEQV
jgi:hypothetical protein